METLEPASQAVTEHERDSHGGEDHGSVAEAGEEVDVAAKMSELQVRDIKQPRLRRLSGSKCPGPVLPKDAFVFEPSMPYRDLGAVELQTDETKQQPETVPERSNYMSPAFTFKLPIHLQGLVTESYPTKLGGIDMAAKMAGWPTYVDKHSPKPVPQNLEHVAPSGSFTFTSAARKLEQRPVKALQNRKDIDVAAKMAELQVHAIEQPRLSRSELPEYVVPNTAFTFERPIWSQDLEVGKASKMSNLPADDASQLPKIAAEHSEHMLPTFRFNRPTHIQELAFEPHINKDKEVDIAAKTDGLPAYIEIQPPKPAPQRPEHEVPSAGFTFTFTSTIQNPQLRPKLGLKQRKGTDLAASMAELQVGDVKQPSETVSNQHVLPNSAFTFKTPIHKPQPIPLFGFKRHDRVDVVAKMADLQVGDEGQPPRTRPERSEHVVPSVAFPFTTLRGGRESGSTSDIKSGATHSTDAQYAALKAMSKRQTCCTGNCFLVHSPETERRIRIDTRNRIWCDSSYRCPADCHNVEGWSA